MLKRITSRKLQNATFTFAALCLLLLGCGGSKENPNFARLVLDNGITVIAQRLDGFTRATVQTFYRNGFVHDMQGAPQSAHYAEHLLARCPTDGFGPGQAWDTVMSRGGSTGAETMPTFTKFDYTMPLNSIGVVLDAEFERLRSLRFDQDVAEFEIGQCYKELTTVESKPSAPVVKFAAMAANQAWRYGLEDVELKGSLDSVGPEQIMSYIRERYTPENLIIVITGSLDPQETVGLLASRFAELPPVPTAEVPAIDWDALPDSGTIRWDSSANAIFLWLKPPADQTERIIVSMWATALAVGMAQDANVNTVARFVMASSYTWPVGELPFLVYATLKPDVDPEEARQTLVARARAILAREADIASPEAVQLFVNDLATLPEITPTEVSHQMTFLQETHNTPEQVALEQILLTHSLNLGLRELLFGGAPEEHVAAINDLDAGGFREILKRVLVPENLRSTLVLAREEKG
jgi:hypothetical protein